MSVLISTRFFWLAFYSFPSARRVRSHCPAMFCGVWGLPNKRKHVSEEGSSEAHFLQVSVHLPCLLLEISRCKRPSGKVIAQTAKGPGASKFFILYIVAFPQAHAVPVQESDELFVLWLVFEGLNIHSTITLASMFFNNLTKH